MRNFVNNGQDSMLKHMVKVKNRPNQKPMVKWCSENCNERWTVFMGWDHMEWRFEQHQDAVWFKLRWGEL